MEFLKLFLLSLPIFWVDRSLGQETLGEFKNGKAFVVEAIA
jgi:hypothetical protein